MASVFVIVGGGISGLAAAYRLSRRLSGTGRPHEIHLLEASPRLGGVIATHRQNGCLLETGPDSFLAEKPRGVQLCEELGLGDELMETRPEFRRSFIAWRGRLHPIPKGFYLLGPAQLLPVLFSPLLSLRGKARMLGEPFVPARPQADEALGSFVRRRLGPEVLERLAQPLVGGIYSADAEQLSLRATFPQFLEMEKSGGIVRGLMRQARRRQRATSEASGARYKLFVTLRGGLETLVERLAQRLDGVKVRTGVAVRTIAAARDAGETRWKLELSTGESLEADGLCLALPAPAAARLLEPVDPELAAGLGGIVYGDSITAHFAFRPEEIRHPLDGIGVVIPDAERRTLAACTFVHRKFAGRAPEGTALLRAFAGGEPVRRLWDHPDEEIRDRLLGDLRDLLGIRGRPLLSTLNRWRQSLPQYGVGHMERVRKLEERIGSFGTLAVAGNWARGVGLPDCIQSGEQAADRLAGN